MKSLKIHILKKQNYFQKKLDQCRYNPNEPQNIPNEIKSALNKIYMEQGLYALVVIILRRESDDKKEKENTKKYNFKGQSERSRRWFDLDHEWLEEIFRTGEPYFYNWSRG